MYKLWLLVSCKIKYTLNDSTLFVIRLMLGSETYASLPKMECKTYKTFVRIGS